MCGIAGIFNLDGSPIDLNILKKMTNALEHRGPDGEGYYHNAMIGLGHRRLAVIDLSSAAAQPMHTQDDRFIISYNGEVYNYKELRDQLKIHGKLFHSETDSEVVLQSLAHWGIDALTKFNGMFAFALWDNQKKQLMLVRDRYGIKPLYYTKINNAFLFASEVKAILAHPSYKIAVDKEALVEYFTFQNFFSEKTLFKNISLLPPATCLMIQQDQKIKTVQYWDYNFKEPADKKTSGRDYHEELDVLFQRGVQRQLVSDVPLGCYLSGGMDSGSIAMLTAKEIKHLQTFTIGCDLNSASGIELSYDERQTAEYISYLAGSEHYEMVLKAGDMERAMSKLVWHLEEPRVGQCYPNFYASKLASKFVKVALAGTGGDELFGGYPWRYYRTVLSSDFEQYIDQYYNYWQRLATQEQLEKLFQPIWNDVKHVSTRDLFKNVFKQQEDKLDRPEDYINHSLHFEAKTFLHGLLVVEDKLSMAHSLETRVPFLDNDIVDFAMEIPVRLKLGNLGKILKLNENEPGQKSRKYYNATNDGKLILRNTMKKYIPESILNKKKQGFSAPDASWFRGESIDYLRKVVFSDDSCIYEFFDKDALRELINEHLSGAVNRRLLIWSILYFEEWCKIFLKGKMEKQ